MVMCKQRDAGMQLFDKTQIGAYWAAANGLIAVNRLGGLRILLASILRISAHVIDNHGE